MDISKKDWKLFRERLSGWQENYIKNGKEKDAKIVEILPVDGVRYTVPKYIRPNITYSQRAYN